MPIWSTATINRFESNGEDTFAIDYPCIVDRISLDITSGTDTYELPDYITRIRRITWKGKKLWPIQERDVRLRSLNAIGTPREYIYDNLGTLKIKLYPIPNETISSVDSNLYGSEIPNRVIVEFYRTASYPAFSLPRFFRRRLLKCYILKSCFQMDGKGSTLKAAKYFSDKFKMLCGFYSDLLFELISRPRKLISIPDAIYGGRQIPNSVRFPDHVRGTGVDI